MQEKYKILEGILKNIKDNYIDDNKEKSKESKFEFSLFKEEDNVVHKLLRIKRIGSLKDEKWKVYEDNKILWVLDGKKLTSKEKDFLRTVDGFNLLLDSYKKNEITISLIKKKIKNKLEDI